MLIDHINSMKGDTVKMDDIDKVEQILLVNFFQSFVWNWIDHKIRAFNKTRAYNIEVLIMLIDHRILSKGNTVKMAGGRHPNSCENR